MKKKLKRLLTGMLTLATVFTALPASTVHASEKQYWTDAEEKAGYVEKVMNAEEAVEFFYGNSKICKWIQAMIEVGLPYLSLGQPLSTLSGGERQRMKLAKYLYQNKGNIYVLEEPTTGLHTSDVRSVKELLDSFVKRGNTVIVIEHNMDVVKQADYVIDIGSDGGTSGGEVIFAGTPQEMVSNCDSIIAKYLRKSLQRTE